MSPRLYEESRLTTRAGFAIVDAPSSEMAATRDERSCIFFNSLLTVSLPAMMKIKIFSSDGVSHAHTYFSWMFILPVVLELSCRENS